MCRITNGRKVTIHNIPDIVDVNKLIVLLGNLGVKIKKNGKGSYTFQADEVNLSYLESSQFKDEGKGLRGSIMIVGPLLARLVRDIFRSLVAIRLDVVVWILTSKDLSTLELLFAITKRSIFME